MPETRLVAGADGTAGAGWSPMTASWALGTAAGRVQAALASDAAPVVAVDLGATHTRVAITGPSGFDRLIVKRTAELPRQEGRGVVPGLVETILETIEATRRGVAPVAIGVGVAAYAGHDGVILQERSFGIPAGGVVRDSLADAFAVPVAVENDANLSAMAEIGFGAGRGLRNVAVITLGTNIGLGIVADGRIVRGAHGAAGEAGTLLVPSHRGRNGRAAFARAGRLGSGTSDAPAGYALLEELVGGGALFRSLGSPASGSAARSENGAASDGIFPRARAGDLAARSAVRHAIEGWAMLIADLVALLDPEAFVLSGGLVEESPAFIEPLRRRAAELCPLPPEIRIGDLGAQSGLVGAVVAARSALQAHVAPDASVVGSDSSTQAFAGSYLSREVER